MKAVQWYLADLLLGETPSLDINTVCSFPEPWVSVAKQTLENVTSDFYVMALNYTAYAGTYSHQAFGNITVYLNTTRMPLSERETRTLRPCGFKTDGYFTSVPDMVPAQKFRKVSFIHVFYSPCTHTYIYTHTPNTCAYIHSAHKHTYIQRTYINTPSIHTYFLFFSLIQ